MQQIEKHMVNRLKEHENVLVRRGQPQLCIYSFSQLNNFVEGYAGEGAYDEYPIYQKVVWVV